MKKKINIKLLRKVQRAILKHADQFVMDSWFSGSVNNGPAGGCGTAACLAGWIVMKGSGHKSMFKTKCLFRMTVSSVASKLIGVPIRQNPNGYDQHPLFFTDQWPEKFRSAYMKAKTSKGEARAAVRRIDHFIKTGE